MGRDLGRMVGRASAWILPALMVCSAAASAQDAGAADGGAAPAVIAPVTKPKAAAVPPAPPKVEIKNAAPTDAAKAPVVKAKTETAPAADAAAAPAKTSAAVKKPAEPEVLPWATGGATTPAGQPAANTGTAAVAPDAAAVPSQCKGIFEAACRENTACAWIADIKLEASTIAAHCMERPRAPPKAETKPAKKPAASTAQKAKDKPATASAAASGTPSVVVPKTDGALKVPAPKDGAPATANTAAKPETAPATP